MHIGLKIIGGLAGLAVLAWSGIRVRPPRFESPNWNSPDLDSVRPPANLPAPVARYAKTVFGDSIPVVESALIVGRADLALNGIAFKGRFKFYHRAGSAYYHDIQLTWFGLPMIRVDEQYKDGQAITKLPGARIEKDQRTNLWLRTWDCGPKPYGCPRYGSRMTACSGMPSTMRRPSSLFPTPLKKSSSR
jgi:hypothetical protein